MNVMELFAGAGGGILGSLLLGHTTVCAVEIDEYCRRVLLQRQFDGILPRFPIWDDMCTFDGRPWRGLVDVVSGGFPCQGISVAGSGAGLADPRSGLWSEMRRVVGEVGPRYVLVENSPMLTRRGLGTVLSDLAEMGFDAEWCVLGGGNLGCPSEGLRLWALATANKIDGSSRVGFQQEINNKREVLENHDRECSSCDPWALEPVFSSVGVDNGMATRLERIGAIGNGQVPLVAATAWHILSERLK